MRGTYRISKQALSCSSYLMNLVVSGPRIVVGVVPLTSQCGFCRKSAFRSKSRESPAPGFACPCSCMPGELARHAHHAAVTLDSYFITCPDKKGLLCRFAILPLGELTSSIGSCWPWRTHRTLAAVAVSLLACTSSSGSSGWSVARLALTVTLCVRRGYLCNYRYELS